MIKSFKKHTPDIKDAVFIAENAAVIGNVILDKNSSVWYSAVLRGDLEPIVVGENSNIQENVSVHVDFNAPVKIGKNVTVGHNVVLHGCEIHDSCLIGMGAVVLNGAVIGEGSIVGANALVTENKVFEPGSLILGSPAKAVKTVSSEMKEHVIKNSRLYVKLAKEHDGEAQC